MPLSHQWLQTLCYLFLSVLYAFGFVALGLLSVMRSVAWFICLPFRLLGRAWRACGGG